LLEVDSMAPCKLRTKNYTISSEITLNIKYRINETINCLSDNLKQWANNHLIKPIYVDVSKNTEGEYNDKVIQVTGNIGNNDSSYHVYYDIKEDKFGLICVLENGFMWNMGIYGEFSETVISM